MIKFNTMKIRTTVIIFSVLYAVALAQVEVDSRQCIRDRERLSKGTCSSAVTTPCRDSCSRNLIVGKSKCDAAPECCFRGNRCVLKFVTPSTFLKQAAMASIERAKQNLQEKAANVVEGNDTEARGLSVGGIGPGGFGGSFPPCQRFPFNCPVQYGTQISIDPPIDIPYCQRIACSSDNPFLENDYQRCVTQPGCYFDAELSQYRRFVGQAILPGVPVCHAVIRNRAFKRRAREVIQQTGSWNPVLTSCLLNEYRNEIFGDAVGCRMIDILEYFGHTPKRAGWSGITERECALIGACWKRPTPYRSFCAYPVNSQGQPTLRSSNDQKSLSHSVQDLYGLPVCYPFSRSLTGRDFLNAYHTCLSSGCATSVDSSLVLQNLYAIGRNLTYPLNLLFHNMVNSGQIRPDNYATVLNDLVKRPYGGFGSGIPNFFPTNPINRPGYPQVFPFALARNASTRNFVVGGGNSNPYGAGIGRFPSSNPQFPQVNPVPFPGFPTNPQGYSPFPPQIYPPRPPSPPINYNPCPFASVNLNYPGLNRLRGRFQGCCDKPLCYVPRSDLDLTYSGLSPYFTLWSSWGDCNVNCGGGSQNRTRSCVTTSYCGPRLRNNLRCDSRISRFQEKRCNTHICPHYGKWTPWSVCSVTCGGGVQTRSRTCNGVGQCSGPRMVTKECKTGACPTFTYGSWGSCSKTCGSGFQYRSKTCANPGGYSCPPPTQDRRRCDGYCGSWKTSCNTNTCCDGRRCLQDNGLPGHCTPEPFRYFPNRCYEGRCRHAGYVRCDNSQLGPYSLNVGG